MIIKTEKLTVEFPNWLIIAGAIIVDNVYANHCKKKSYKTMVDGVINANKPKKEGS